MSSYAMRYPSLTFLEKFPNFIYRAYMRITDNFYERLRNQPPKVIVRYNQLIRPKGLIDRICFFFDFHRRVKYVALKRVAKDKGLENII